MAERDPRITGPTLKVLKHFLTSREENHSGAAISKATGVGASTLYPLLARLEDAGWIAGRWEEIDPSEAGRPRRRYYQLTPIGLTRSRAEFASLQIPSGEGVPSWVS